MEKSKRQMEDQEPETSSSKKSKVEMASSAFDRQQDATTIVLNWKNDVCFSYDSSIESGVFGSKKTRFYISIKPKNIDPEVYHNEYSELEEEVFNVYLNLAKSSIKKKVFIESLSISADNSNVFHNKGIFSYFNWKTANLTHFFHNSSHFNYSLKDKQHYFCKRI